MNNVSGIFHTLKWMHDFLADRVQLTFNFIDNFRAKYSTSVSASLSIWCLGGKTNSHTLNVTL